MLWWILGECIGSCHDGAVVSTGSCYDGALVSTGSCYDGALVSVLAHVVMAP
jgi:hypothetical protein